MPIDMWSLGCILAELYTGYPLFPGENEVEQLACIMEVFDYPPSSLLVEAQRRKLFFGGSTLTHHARCRLCGVVQCHVLSHACRLQGPAALHHQQQGEEAAAGH